MIVRSKNLNFLCCLLSINLKVLHTVLRASLSNQSSGRYPALWTERRVLMAFTQTIAFAVAGPCASTGWFFFFNVDFNTDYNQIHKMSSSP